MEKVVVHPRPVKERPRQLDLEDLIALAGWDPKDPGVGRAVIAEDGREILNPAKFEEPADIEEGQDMMLVLERRIMQKLKSGLFTGEEEVDESVAEASDFAIDDDVQYVSGYEVSMQEEFPNFPAPAPRPNEQASVEAGAKAPAVEVSPEVARGGPPGED